MPWSGVSSASSVPSVSFCLGPMRVEKPVQIVTLTCWVVMPVHGSRREKQVDIGVALDDIRVPIDVVVTSPEDFACRKEVVGTIEYPAVKEGKVLYARE